MQYVTGWDAEDTSWQLALSLIAAWRETDGARREALAQRLAGLAAEGGAAAVEHAVLGLTALGNMFVELYADSAGRSVETILADAAALEWDDGPPGSAAGRIRRAAPAPGRAYGTAAGAGGRACPSDR
jgi:hypothetical protein